jgi:CRP-like cAMP-binding protein
MLNISRSNFDLFLDRLNSRSVLTEVEQDRVRALPFRVRQVSAHCDVVKLGEVVDQACFVTAGLVGRYDQNAGGDRQITALHIPGDMPDLHSVVQPTATSALEALSTTTVMEIPHFAIRSAAAAHPALAEAFWRDSMVDAMILAQWVVNVGCRDARSRIAHLLCEMACRYKVVPKSGKVEFTLGMTQAQMADATGLTSVHINRTLKRLAEIGTTFRNQKVKIDNWDALVEVGDFDRRYLQDEIPAEERVRIASRPLEPAASA